MIVEKVERKKREPRHRRMNPTSLSASCLDEIIADLKAQNEGLINRLTVIEQRQTENNSGSNTITGKAKIETDDDYFRFIANEENKRVLMELYHQQPVWSDGDFGKRNLKIIKDLELLDLINGKTAGMGGYNYTISDKGKSYLKKSGVK